MARNPIPTPPAALLAAGAAPVDIDRLASRHTLILYDRETGAVAGEHEVITLPGGTDSPDDPADALELAASTRPRLARHRHEGKLPEGQRLSLQLKAGKPVVKLVAEPPVELRKPRRPA